MPIDLSKPPKLWVPSKPAIIRANDLPRSLAEAKDIKLGGVLPGIGPAAGLLGPGGIPGWIFTGGSADASSAFSPAGNAFDFDNGTAWVSNSAANEWVRYALAAPRLGNSLRLRNAFNSGTSTYRLQNFKLQGSADNSSWTDLVTNTLPGDASDHDFAFTGVSYRYWRLYCTDGYGGAHCGVTEFQVYGLV